MAARSCDVGQHAELVRRVPSFPIEQQGGVAPPGDIPRDLVEMELHGAGADEGKARAAHLPRARQIVPSRSAFSQR